MKPHDDTEGPLPIFDSITWAHFTILTIAEEGTREGRGRLFVVLEKKLFFNVCVSLGFLFGRVYACVCVHNYDIQAFLCVFLMWVGSFLPLSSLPYISS